jgi:hypothetical protein
MGRKRAASRADQELLDALGMAGFPDYSARTLENWRAEQVLPTTDREFLGRPGGSTSHYPPGAKEQAVALALILKRHRDYDKAAVLLWLHGYAVGPERVRAALLVGLDYIDAKINEHSAADPEQRAQAIAEAILSERLRTKEGRAWRREMIRQAGGRERLKQTYARLARPLIGGANLGGLLAAFGGIGHDFRQLLNLDEHATAAFERQMDLNFAEVNSAGGATQLLRKGFTEAPPEGLDAFRGLVREALSWMLSLGLTFSPPPGYYADLSEALLHPDVDDQAEPANTMNA